jgi:putative nucleotidyltransferase with HDIG domain
MSKRITELSDNVRSLYESNDPNQAADWVDWLADNHVFVVADYAGTLAKTYGANEELARAAALLHDIADVRMKRTNKSHKEESLRMARELMQKLDYSEDEIKLVVDDAIRYHSCHGDERPESVEGKVLATADSLAHLKTDFYLFAMWALGRRGMTPDEIKQWTLEKLERDLQVKIFFDEARESCRPDYEMLKELFSR